MPSPATTSILPFPVDRSGSRSRVMVGPRRLGEIVSLASTGGRVTKEMGSQITTASPQSIAVPGHSATKCVQGWGWGFDGRTLWMDHGCQGSIDVNAGGSGGYPDYAAADRNLQAMIQRIQACTLDANAQVPSSWMLAAPNGSAPADVVAAYNSYSLRLNSELPEARANAGVFCRAGTSNAGTSPSSGSLYCAPGYVNQPPYGCVPARSMVIGDQGSPYSTPVTAEGSDIYTPEITSRVNQGENFATVVPNPYAPQPSRQTVVEPDHRRRNMAVGGGAIALLAIAAFALGRRKKRGAA